MKPVLVFGGTSETHALLLALSRFSSPVTLCVASSYAEALALQDHPRLTVHVGRLDAAQMSAMITEISAAVVVDATHPYATAVTKNIKTAAADTGIPYLRLRRADSDLSGVITVSSAAAAAAVLIGMEGNVLLTTGSKDLPAYTMIPDYEKRLYPRVLPAVDSIETCLSLGYQPSRIIAMQGPFSAELNIALLRQFNINILVTKDGGAPGGFPEKMEAAKALGVSVIVLGRPEDDGCSLSEIVEALSKLLEEKP